MSLEQYLSSNDYSPVFIESPLVNSTFLTGEVTYPKDELHLDIKVAEYLIHACQYSLKEYLELSFAYRKVLNESTLNYLSEKKSTVKNND